MSSPLAAYGLGFTGLDDVGLLPRSPAGAASPIVSLSFGAHSGGAEPDGADGDGYRRTLRTGHVLSARRHPATATVEGPSLPADERIHPYLAPIAAVHSRWLGRTCFHGGVFASAGRAWVVLGRREIGKSSLLATLAARGIPVLADDLAVVDAGPDPRVFSGPACVDLRELPPSFDLAVTPVRQGTRFRLALPPAPFELPLGGWVFPRWGDRLGLTRLGGAPLLRLLTRATRQEPGGPPLAIQLLELAARPAWVWDRPRSWDRAAESVDALLAGLDRHAVATVP